MSITKYQKFTAQEIHRGEIKNAPYNPRQISPKGRAKLKKNIKQRGLLETLVWNKLTGNLVSGHQRLAILDELEGSGDYSLTVAVVELDEKQEKEQNIFFNSTTVQGFFDFDKLNLMLDEIDPFDAGFDEADLHIIGYDLAASALITPAQAQAEQEIDDFFSGDDEGDEPASAEDIKAAKQRIKDGAAERMDEGERYVSILFDSYQKKAQFMKSLGLPPDDLFVKYDIFKARQP
jgi:hypothetical protein